MSWPAVLLFVVRAIHFAYVAFVFATPFWLIGAALLARPSLAPPPLRYAHLAALAFAVGQLAFEWRCPLTMLENAIAGRPADAVFLPVDAIPEAPTFAALVFFAALSSIAHALARRPGWTA